MIKSFEKTFFFLLRLPFEWRSPVAYLIAVIFEAIETIAMVLVYLYTLTLFFGTCMFLAAFCADLQKSLQLLDRKMEKIADDIKAKRWIDRGKIEELLHELIHFHSDAIQLSFELKHMKLI